MTRLVFAPDATSLPKRDPGTVPVAQYHYDGVAPGMGRVGRMAFSSVRRLSRRSSSKAFDFLTLALAVTAAETFVGRHEAPDGWTRKLDLVVPLHDPAPWLPVAGRLAEVLRFLTGDAWSLELTKGGLPAPSPGNFHQLVQVGGHDGVCLFSGGLDSAIGVVDLLARDARPLLVSHAYRDDGPKQVKILNELSHPRPSRFPAAANPRKGAVKQPDNTMRGRSVNFLAFAAIAASTFPAFEKGEEVDLFVPENGFIALNPPATDRRLGSLSTRTTHPHFLGEMQAILRAVGLPLRLTNPYEHMTKGEMLRSCADQPTLRRIAGTTVSCGKWKRTRKQCGKCLPCLIRRASFHAAAWDDPTTYAEIGSDLPKLLAEGDAEQRGDLLAMLQVTRLADAPELERRVWLTGPLPLRNEERAPYLDVARRGLREIRDFLNSNLTISRG